MLTRHGCRELLMFTTEKHGPVARPPGKHMQQTGLGRLAHRPAQGAVTGPLKGASCLMRQLHSPAYEEGQE